MYYISRNEAKSAKITYPMKENLRLDILGNTDPTVDKEISKADAHQDADETDATASKRSKENLQHIVPVSQSPTVSLPPSSGHVASELCDAAESSMPYAQPLPALLETGIPDAESSSIGVGSGKPAASELEPIRVAVAPATKQTISLQPEGQLSECKERADDHPESCAAPKPKLPLMLAKLSKPGMYILKSFH